MSQSQTLGMHRQELDNILHEGSKDKTKWHVIYFECVEYHNNFYYAS